MRRERRQPISVLHDHGIVPANDLLCIFVGQTQFGLSYAGLAMVERSTPEPWAACRSQATGRDDFPS